MEAWAMTLAFVAMILAIYYYIFKDLSYFKKIGLPYLPPWPVLGNMGPALLRVKPVAEIIVKVYEFCPKAKYVGFFDLTNRVIVIRDPELIKSIGVKHFDNFVNHRQILDESVDPIFGRNLFALTNDRWRETRTMLSPAFTSSKLKGMFTLMNDCGADFTDYLSKMPKEQQTIEMKSVFTRYTNDVIATCAYGISVNSMKDPDNDFYVLGTEATNFGGLQTLKFFLMNSFPKLATFLKIKFLSPRATSFFTGIFKHTIDTRDQQKIVRNDVIQLMMEARDKRRQQGRPELELIDMVAQAFIFFFGGFDSVSTAMCFTCHAIGVNPDIQERLQREIDQAMEDSNGKPTYEIVNNLPYLDAVINESLRRYPIVVMLDRVCNESFELPPSMPGCKPLKVEKGQAVWFPVYGLHHDPNYFEEPYKFNPDRFMDHGKEIQSSGVYLPFGLGPRMCIGNRFALMEMKVLIFHLLAKCNLKPSAKTAIPLELSKKHLNMTASNGFWMAIEKRTDVNQYVRDQVPEKTGCVLPGKDTANGAVNGHAVKA